VPIKGRTEQRMIGFEVPQDEDGKGFKKYTFEDIMKAVEFELDHVIFRVGDRLLKQCRGIPMGGSLSAIVCRVTLAFDEHMSLERLTPVERNCIGGRRFMDDLFLAAAREKDAPKAVTQVLMRKITYNKSLELVTTSEEGAKWHRYLEGEVAVDDCGKHILCRFFNPNAVSLASTGLLAKPRIKSWFSFGSRHKKGVQLSCTFARMRGYSLNLVREQTLRGAQYIDELLHINYPVQFLISRLRTVKSHLLADKARRTLVTALRNCTKQQMTSLCQNFQRRGAQMLMR